MGQSESSPLLAPLMTLLKRRGLSVKKSSLLRFLDDVTVFAPWFAQTGSLSLPSWIKLGHDMDRARRTGLCLDPILVPVWETVRACLEAEAATGLGPSLVLQQARGALRETQSVLSADGSCKGEPPIRERPESSDGSDTSDSESDDDQNEGVDEPPLIDWERPPASPTQPSAPPMSTRRFSASGHGDPAKKPHRGLPLVAESGCTGPPLHSPEFPGSWVGEGQPQLYPPPAYAGPQDSISLSSGKRHFWKWTPSFTFRPFGVLGGYQPLKSEPDSEMYPVIINPQGGNQHESYDYKVLRELRQAVHQYGPNAPFTLNLVENLATLNHTPADIYQLARACLPPGRYIDWKAWFEELAEEQAAKNAAVRRGAWNADMLLGKGPHSQNQTGFPIEVYGQIFRCFIGAWKKLMSQGEAQASLSNIHQGPTEPFVEFVARIQHTAERIFTDPGIAETVVKQMIFEQCNKDCKVILVQNKGKSLTDWVRLCRDAGSPLTSTTLAAMLASSLRVNAEQAKNAGARQKGCFQCGKPGHIKRNCPNMSQLTHTQQVAKLCGRCRKGPHRAEDCRSAFDANGKRLSGRPEQAPKNGQRGSAFPVDPLAGNTMMQHQSKSVPPMSQQDWTSVPPPHSY
ncbi:endogenous retrovirus group K member 24 Gag polyprotein-like [Tamandua tetradactyla]|uniref:endogenous retrovirus group K member 24 Gag polyprotein-like n=1 Tax=Tamandua tetradactyla TaxID=48850 RepID=UPI004053FC87